ncbi:MULTISPECIES: hypothetical protein [unclassified Streptomyces]|uniref:hypothetical protein n=1 Tax=unclassified Streptomyces TaxID=2593676 RepID=UPI001F04AB32|nr:MULTISPECIES: hypothetical protein [unclassified Streptomyces]MCH0562708.1 hypothetical protein [Streptomyces sp. MUM 2J]MCH0567780.1 hypothetical protein [Streptomyces sp. MUM 136J]
MDAPLRFAQIIDFETDRIDEIRRLAEEADERLADRAYGPTRRLVLKDRNQPDRYLVVVEFDSHEDAVRNSDDPETGKLAEQMAALCTRPPAFTDCDVQERADFT